MSDWNKTVQGMFAEERAQKEATNVAKKPKAAKKLSPMERSVRRNVNAYLGEGDYDPDSKITKATPLSFVTNDDDSMAMARGLAEENGFAVTLDELKGVTTYGGFLTLMMDKRREAIASRVPGSFDKWNTVNNKPPLPSVNEVSQAFHDLHGDVRRAMYHNKGNDPAAQAEIDTAYAKLREKLQSWGMADKIDWSKEG